MASGYPNQWALQIVYTKWCWSVGSLTGIYDQPLNNYVINWILSLFTTAINWKCQTGRKHLPFNDDIHSKFSCNELNVALPLSDPPLINLPDFLISNNLTQCIPMLEQHNVRTLDELRRLNGPELVAMGITETDARQIHVYLTRQYNFNHAGAADSFDSFCANRNETINKLFNEPQSPRQFPSTLQQSTPRPPLKRSPLLSASSVATNQTAITCNSNASSSAKSDRSSKRSTLGDGGFFVWDRRVVSFL